MELFKAWFDIAWFVLNIQIPIFGGLVITPFAVIITSILIAMLIKYVYKKGQSDE